MNKNHYFRHIFRLSLIVSITFLAILFYLFPRFNRNTDVKKTVSDVKIYVSDIPVTIQKTGRPKLPPRRPDSGIPVASENIEIPDELPLDQASANLEIQGADSLAAGLMTEVPARPLLEIYPDVKGSSCKGYISLLLLVDTSGKIEDMKVLKNTTQSDSCLKQVREAVFKSVWIPARAGEKKVKSWTKKTYKFNIN